MITRRRRQGSESEHQPFAEPQSQNQVLKGSSSVLLWSGESPQQQPSFFIVPQGEIGAFVAPNFSTNNFLDVQAKTNTADMMASASISSSSVHGVIGRPQNPQAAKNTDQHQQYSEFMKVAK